MAEHYTVESSGSQAAISDQWAAKVNCSSIFRLMCLAWLIPAVSMIWLGFTAIGLRPSDRQSFEAAFDRIQAVAVLLTIFSSLLGLIWALRVWAYLPAIERIGTAGGRLGPMSHVASALVGVLALTLASALTRAQIQSSVRSVLVTIAALGGFWACSLAGRWVLRAPIMSPFPIAMLFFGSGFQVTIGWVHGVEPAAGLAPLLVIEGLLLTWTALAAARAVAKTALADAAAAHSAYAARVASDTRGPVLQPEAASLPEVGQIAVSEESTTTSQAPALQPLPTPAVGH